MADWRRVLVTGWLCAICTLLAGCSPGRLVSTLTSGENTENLGSFTYGGHSRQVLDVYRPAASSGETSPVVIFFYGGRWQKGSRRDYGFVANALAEKGIVTVVPDYRVHPEVRFPSFVEDGAEVVRWVRRNIADYGGDAKQIFLMGHSAGAHIAALLAFDERYLGTMKGSDGLAGFIGLAGPYDFLPLTDPTLKDIFGPSRRYPDSQPVNFVDGKEPPALLLHGADDSIVWPRNTLRMAAAIEQAGGRVAAKVYPQVNHVRIVGALATPFEDWAPVRRDVFEFIKVEGNQTQSG